MWGTRLLVAVALVAASLTAAGGGPAEASAPICDVRDPAAVALNSSGLTSFTDEPGAGRWETWTVDIGDVYVPPPPSTASVQGAAEVAFVYAAVASRDATAEAAARRWGTAAAGDPWTERLLELVKKYSTDPLRSPPRFARQMAMFQTAILDALVITWNAKYCYQRPAPPVINRSVEPADAPSYPSEHAAVAGVASVLLREFFPEEPRSGVEDMAWAAAASRISAGTNYPSDVSAGWAIGNHVARAVKESRTGDGSEAVWDGSGRIEGRCNWEPTPPAFRYPPAEPMWGKVRPWLMRSGDALRPGPPPECDSDEFMAAAEDLYHASLNLTDRQKQIAQYWAGGPGTETPPGMGLRVGLEASRRHELGTMRQARVMAYVGAALADAGIAAWDAKFTYWSDRPVLSIRRHFDRTWTSFIGTPPFPGYVSGHSTFSGAAADTLAHFFPDEAVSLRAMATDAAMSRFYGGIHVRYDNEVGLEVGAGIAELAAARASADGAD